MKLLIGLGNPEEKYLSTRHNVGFMFVDSLDFPNIKALKSETFMNSSGNFVKEKVNYFKVDPKDLYIIHDDLDIPLGEYKIQFGKGPKLHNGILSIEEKLGTSDFWRIRIGVDNRDPENRIPGQSYVLQNFLPEEQEILKKVFENIKKELETNAN